LRIRWEDLNLQKYYIVSFFSLLQYLFFFCLSKVDQLFLKFTFFKFMISISQLDFKFYDRFIIKFIGNNLISNSENSLTASSPARGKSPRRSRSMRTVTDRQSTGEDNVRFHDRQTWLTLARSARSRWPNICVNISSGSWSHISRLQLDPSSSLLDGWLKLSLVVLFFGSCCRISSIAIVKNDRSWRIELKCVPKW